MTPLTIDRPALQRWSRHLREGVADLLRHLDPHPAGDARLSEALAAEAVRGVGLAHYRVGGRGKRGRILIDPADLEAVIRECRRDRHPLLDE